MNRWTIAIDGPAGAGKSTVARLLAARLHLAYVDTGAMYRAIGLAALRQNVPLDAGDALTRLAQTAQIEFRAQGEGMPQRVYLDGNDVTGSIRTPDVSSLASQVSVIAGVRRALVAQQQRMGASGGVVMEGRDIGTVVFPNADGKFFLTATPEARAKRRLAELAAQGTPRTLADVLAEQELRDLRDSTRAESPLVAAPDAVVILSDGKTPSEIVDEITRLMERRGATQ